jgi:hypothetical protein
MVLRNRVADGIPKELSSNRVHISLVMVSRCCWNDSVCTFAIICPAPVKNASNTGAVINGNGACGWGGNFDRNRLNHLMAPL